MFSVTPAGGTGRDGWRLDPALLFHFAGSSAAAAFLMVCVVLTGTGVATAALAERGSGTAVAVGAAIVAGGVVPVAGRWAWYGWLADRHFVDVGGAAAIHLSAAVVAAVAVAVVGARSGKYAGGASQPMPGHALPWVGLGAVVTWVGWVPYLVGSALAHATVNGAIDDWPSTLATAAANTLLAGAGGAAGGLCLARVRFGKPDLFYAVAGLTGGLVAVSAGAIALGNAGAVGVGVVAGFLVPAAAAAMDGRARLDDPTGAIAVHGVGGLWGTLAVPLLCPRRLPAGDVTAELVDRLRLLAVQVAGAAAIIAFAAVVATVAFVALRLLRLARVSADAEAIGLDAAELGVVAYPEFATAAEQEQA